MYSLNDIFRAFGGPSEVGRSLSISTEHAAAMRRRGSIPARYWVTIVKSAEAKGIHGVTLEALAMMHARERAAS